MVFKLFYTCFILINFTYFYRGVKKGQKLNQKGHHENETTHYQCQHRDSTVEKHVYDELRQPRVEDTQMLTVYESIL